MSPFWPSFGVVLVAVGIEVLTWKEFDFTNEEKPGRGFESRRDFDHIYGWRDCYSEDIFPDDEQKNTPGRHARHDTAVAGSNASGSKASSSYASGYGHGDGNGSYASSCYESCTNGRDGGDSDNSDPEPVYERWFSHNGNNRGADPYAHFRDPWDVANERNRAHAEHQAPDWDMTADYYGRHGEFDRNDEDRAICEDMQQMRASDSDTDLSYHYGWENGLNYDTDDYDED